MPDLTTVPSFIFYHGKLGDNGWERPIHVQFYNGSITIEQQGEYDVPESIQLSPAYVKKLLKEIIKHIPDAQYWLDKK
jgi:hypothetical protein